MTNQKTKTMIKYLVTTILLSAISITTKAQSNELNWVYNNGEKLVYTCSFVASIWPRTDVGNVTFAVNETSYNGIPAYKITALAETNNFFSVFYKMRDFYSTHVDKKTFLPLAHDCEKREGNYHFGSKIQFDWNEKVASSWYKNYRRNNDTNKTLQLTESSMDPIGYFYKIRSEDFSNWKDGDGKIIDIVLEDTVQKIQYQLIKRENISTADYKDIPTLKFACQLSHSVSDDQKTRDYFYIWFSDDKNKVPVLVEAPTKIGKIKARLTSYSGLKYEEESILK